MLFQNLYKVRYPVKQFTSLCAYLCAILRTGYRIQIAELDHFIYMFQDYERAYTLEAIYGELKALKNNGYISVSAYHVWFTHFKRKDTDLHTILKEYVLRTI